MTIELVRRDPNGRANGSTPGLNEIGEKLFANSAGVNVTTSGSYITVATITLTAGVWLVSGIAAFNPGGIVGCTGILMAISSTTNAADSVSLNNLSQLSFTTTPANANYQTIGPRYVVVSTPTSYFLVGRANFTTVNSANWDANSSIQAIRIA
jgi:hypothetical protein